MKNFTTFLGIFSFLLLLNCGSISQVANQVIEIQNGKVNFEIVNNKILLESKIDKNSKLYKFMFDTGATFSAITDTTIIADYPHRKFSKSIVSPVDASGNKLANKNMSIAFENKLFQTNNLYVNTYQKDSISCKRNDYQGIIGADFLSSENKVLYLDFDKNEMQIVDSNFSKNGFVGLETKMSSAHFLIALEVANKKDFFLFDTGNSGNIIMKNFPIDKKYSFEDREGMNFITAANTISRNTVRIYNEIPAITKGSTTLNNVTLTDKISQNNIGLKFIKNFNWILDWKNKKVYAKPRQNPDIDKKKLQDYIVYSQQNKLVIVNKNKLATKYNLGQQIISVNGTQITPENICQYQKLLNETENWDTLNLVVK